MGLSDDIEADNVAMTRVYDDAEQYVLKKRKRDSSMMLRRYKRLKGQSKFYSEVFKRVSPDPEHKSDVLSLLEEEGARDCI